MDMIDKIEAILQKELTDPCPYCTHGNRTGVWSTCFECNVDFTEEGLRRLAFEITTQLED